MLTDEHHYAPVEHWGHLNGGAHVGTGCMMPCYNAQQNCNGCRSPTGCFCSDPGPAPTPGPTPPPPFDPSKVPSLPGNPKPIGCDSWRQGDPICKQWSDMNNQMKLNYELCGTPAPCDAMTKCQKAAWGKDGVFANHVNAFAAGVQAKNNLERAKTQGQVATVREQISDRSYSNNPDYISPYS